VWYLTLALAALAPLLGRGYVLTLDMAFVPRFQLEWETFASGESLVSMLPVRLLLVGLTSVVPGDVLQKLVLLAILVGAAGCMHIALAPARTPARLFGATLYAFNPFVHERLLAGHWLLLLAYAATPLVVTRFLHVLREPSPRGVVLAALGWTLATLLNPHHALLLGLALLACLLGQVFFLGKPSLRLAAAVGIGASWLGFNGFWLLPVVLGLGRPLLRYGTEHLFAFATATDHAYGIEQNVLGLYGFWREPAEMDLSKYHLPHWPLFYVVLMLPVLGGVVWGLRAERARAAETLALILMAAVGLYVALGVSEHTYQVNIWLFEHVPAFGGLREPQKASALLALSYAWLGGRGINLFWHVSLQKALWRHIKVMAVTALVLLTLVYNHRMLWGSWGQLHAARYPAAWSKTEQVSKYEGGQLLILPWKQYHRLDFAGRVVANPARDYFSVPVLMSRDMEMPGVDTQDRDPASQAVLSLLRTEDVKRWQIELDALKVRFILVNRTEYGPDFSFLVKGGYFIEITRDRYTVVYKRL